MQFNVYLKAKPGGNFFLFLYLQKRKILKEEENVFNHVYWVLMVIQEKTELIKS